MADAKMTPEREATVAEMLNAQLDMCERRVKLETKKMQAAEQTVAALTDHAQILRNMLNKLEKEKAIQDDRMMQLAEQLDDCKVLLAKQKHEADQRAADAYMAGQSKVNGPRITDRTPVTQVADPENEIKEKISPFSVTAQDCGAVKPSYEAVSKNYSGPTCSPPSMESRPRPLSEEGIKAYYDNNSKTGLGQDPKNEK